MLYNEIPRDFPETPKMKITQDVREVIKQALLGANLNFDCHEYEMSRREDSRGVTLDIHLTRKDDPTESIVLNIDIAESFG